jgi:SAM-dependent methyltransferase
MGASAPERPQDYRDIWNRKPSLRAVYGDIYRRILDASVPGAMLELGGGSGNFKESAPAAISSDIIYVRWLDVMCDAQQLPFADRTFANVVMVDVMHHVQYPVRAFAEIRRVLRPKGRLVMCEPAITPLSGIFYRLFHEEPVDMTVDPLTDGPISPDRDPYESNQAIPTLLVGRDHERLAKAVPGMALLRTDWFSFLAYPLSGGFQPWSAVPAALVGPLLRGEWRLRRLLGPVAAFRLLAVYERRD